MNLLQILNNFSFTELNAAMGFRYVINMVAVFVLIRGIYYNTYHRKDLFLTFFSFNTIIFFVTYLLNKVEMTTGAAFGLFAVFSILRYRTEGISAKDMTYVFLCIAIGLLTAVSNGSWLDELLICALIILITYLLESSKWVKKESSKTVYYDNIQLVHESNKDKLLQDLILRTGLTIHRIEIVDIDFLKDSSKIIVYYFEK